MTRAVKRPQSDKTSIPKWFLKTLFLYVPAFFFVVIGGLLIQTEYLEPIPWYRAFTEAAARAGYVIIIVAVTLLVLDLAAIVTYMIRHGTKDDSQGSVVEEGPLPMDVNMGVGRSKRKILYKRNDFISMKSLVSGTATRGERMMVLGFFVLVTSFVSIFVGSGLMFMKDLLVMGLFFPAIPVFWAAAKLACPIWRDYREEKARFQAKHPHAAGTSR